ALPGAFREQGTPMSTRNDGPDRIDAYRVSYVIWTRQDGENGRRKRELREELYAGRTADEAADGAVRRASEAYPPDSGWHLDGVEVTATSHVFTMERCGKCGKFRGL